MKIDSSNLDQSIIKELKGTHPKVMREWLKNDKGLYQVDSSYKLTKKQKKHRIMLKFEKLFGLELSKKHFKLVK